ncbi:MAG: hypothetical protein K8963_03000, partial [Proteobacteria bacterium]|nr:hypothetical protein [Pseudomonadota bacterium]
QREPANTIKTIALAPDAPTLLPWNAELADDLPAAQWLSTLFNDMPAPTELLVPASQWLARHPHLTLRQAQWRRLDNQRDLSNGQSTPAKAVLELLLKLDEASANTTLSALSTNLADTDAANHQSFSNQSSYKKITLQAEADSPATGSGGISSTERPSNALATTGGGGVSSTAQPSIASATGGGGVSSTERPSNALVATGSGTGSSLAGTDVGSLASRADSFSAGAGAEGVLPTATAGGASSVGVQPFGQASLLDLADGGRRWQQDGIYWTLRPHRPKTSTRQVLDDDSAAVHAGLYTLELRR